MVSHRRKLIYLLGFMGSGKSTIGELLARQIKWAFIDLDSTIEAGQGVSIREIFENAGEPFFRQVEHAALTEASRTEPAVISLGGGTWIQKPNMDFIQTTKGTTIWLDCGLEELRRRCAGIQNRPLFKDPESFARLYNERIPYYRLAERQVATEGLTPDEVVQKILQFNLF
ncbi:MAG: shikimate kinase [Terriglobia bacterium]